MSYPANRAGTAAEALTSVGGDRSRRFTAWPLWGTATGLLATVAVLAESRVDGSADFDLPVMAEHVTDLDNGAFRIGGAVGYLAVLGILVFAAVWHQRVGRRFAWSTGATVVTYGLVASAGIMALAFGWRAALGLYLPGGPEAGTYDADGLYGYYIMNDFSPYITGVPLLVCGFGIAWMAFAEKLVSRALGAAAGLLAGALLVATFVLGVPGLPGLMHLAMAVAGVWLAVGRSPITQEPQ